MIVSEVIDTLVGDAHVTAEQIADVNIGTYGSGDYVLSTGRKLEAELISNNTVRIFDGAMVYCGVRDVVAANNYHDVTIENGSQGMNRNDIIVRYFKKDEETLHGSAEFKAIKGTPTEGEASDPAIEVTDLRTGALEHSMLMYRVKLEGLNVISLEPLFDILYSAAELKQEVTELNSKIHVVAIENSENWSKIIKFSDGTVTMYGHKEYTGINCTISAGGVYQSAALNFSTVPEGIQIGNVIASVGIGSLDSKVSYHRCAIENNAVRITFKATASTTGINMNVSVVAYGIWS